jgi:excisionase family DNA binding protein
MLKRKEPPVQVKLQSRQRTAAQWNVNIRTIDKMVERGELQSARLGRRVMISIASVNALLGER